jgi:hypothetical protein
MAALDGAAFSAHRCKFHTPFKIWLFALVLIAGASVSSPSL